MEITPTNPNVLPYFLHGNSIDMTFALTMNNTFTRIKKGNSEVKQSYEKSFYIILNHSTL